MKKWISGILAIVMVVAVFSIGAFAAPVNTGYSDVDPNGSYAAAVKELTDKGIMDGVGGGTFDPSGTVNRAQAITVLGRMAGAKQEETAKFSDIEANGWYSGYVGWAVENGIVEGDGQGHFMPDRMVTSEHLNLMLSRYCKLKSIEVNLYDTSAATVTRADLAQRLYTILNAGKTPEPSNPGTTVYPVPTAPATTKPIEAVFASTTSGGVMGYNQNGINYFWGVPYAKAERFMPPEAYDSWGGYRVCWTIGESAPQNDSVSPFDFMPNSMQVVEDEANLFKLQIQSPDLNPATPKPVIVWLHGGGYTTGASMEFDMYSGANLAEYGDVVFVGVNHRLNVLGFLDLSAYGSGEYKYSGNVGILDIEFALQWVQDNIDEFGGDPDNVTIIGQSGGGGKVTTLMSMPSAKDLFHKAAALSGGSAQITRTTAQAQTQTEGIWSRLGITEGDVTALQAVPYKELYAAATASGVSYGPVHDGDLIPTGTFVLESFDKPFIAGSVLGEFSTNIGGMATHNQASPAAFAENSLDLPTAEVLAQLNTRYSGKGQEILDAFRQAYPGHKDAGALYLNNRVNGFMVPSRMLTPMNLGGGTVYQYVQAYVYPMFGGVVPIHTASCIPFWFHNMEYIPAWIAGDEAVANRVADQMAGALASFAHTGNPSQSGLAWEPWTAENGAVMVFDTNSSMRYNHDKQLFDLMVP